MRVFSAPLRRTVAALWLAGVVIAGATAVRAATRIGAASALPFAAVAGALLVLAFATARGSRRALGSAWCSSGCSCLERVARRGSSCTVSTARSPTSFDASGSMRPSASHWTSPTPRWRPSSSSSRYVEPGYRVRGANVSRREYERAASTTLAAKQRLFGHGIYAIGPQPRLVGRPKPAASAAAALRATIDEPQRLATVHTGSAFVPSNITGRLTGSGARAGLPLAVALNGRIAATGWSAQLAGGHSIIVSFMVPPRLLHDGHNDARVYLIDDERLVPL
jgi:hypothetical protein